MIAEASGVGEACTVDHDAVFTVSPSCSPALTASAHGRRSPAGASDSGGSRHASKRCSTTPSRRQIADATVRKPAFPIDESGVFDDRAEFRYRLQ
ncbi:hypothetical protein GCM10011490_00730 [Pseudoclavibacter endophyticus]|nr:hypothetical protein GCM10011490_00730 [Pseudoclavibacter endophyticus]